MTATVPIIPTVTGGWTIGRSRPDIARSTAELQMEAEQAAVLEALAAEFAKALALAGFASDVPTTALDFEDAVLAMRLPMTLLGRLAAFGRRARNEINGLVRAGAAKAHIAEVERAAVAEEEEILEALARQGVRPAGYVRPF